jgi:hypothetical protein
LRQIVADTRTVMAQRPSILRAIPGDRFKRNPEHACFPAKAP